MKRCFLHLTFILFSTAILLGCQPTRTAFPHISSEEIHAEQEYQRKLVARKQWKKDQKHKKMMLKKHTRLIEVSDKVAESAIDMCSKIANNNNFCVYEFDVVNSSNINAWTDGKKITVTTAMMNFAKNDDDLALVLGHELAHNMAQHVQSSEANALLGSLLGIIADKALGGIGAHTGGIFQRAGQEIAILTYSQDMEREADYIGMYITYNANYKIANAANFWRKLSLRNLQNKESAVLIASTHPTNPERFVALNKTYKEIGYKIAQGAPMLPTLNTSNLQASN